MPFTAPQSQLTSDAIETVEAIYQKKAAPTGATPGAAVANDNESQPYKIGILQARRRRHARLRNRYSA